MAGIAVLVPLVVVLVCGGTAHADVAGDASAAPPAPSSAPVVEAPGVLVEADSGAESTPDVQPATADAVGAPAVEPVVVEPVAVEPVAVEPVAVEPVSVEPAADVAPVATATTTAVAMASRVTASRVTAHSHSSPAVHQCNADTFPTSAGWEATCTVIVENTLGDDGATGSRVTTTWCLAEAGVLPPEGCTTDVSTFGTLVSSVDQCNGILAGGSNVTCTVEVVNNVPFGTPTTGVTVNQCIGSGQGGVSPGGPPTDCDPVDSSTSGATVTQCNGSANGGGGPERVQCSVVGATSALPVTVNQCNGSTAAGSTVTCQVSYRNNFAAAPTPTPTDDNSSPTPTATDTGTLPSAGGTTSAAAAGPVPAATTSRSRGSGVPSDGSTTARTRLAATGPADSTRGLVSTATMLLLLGSLLTAASTRAVRH